jgi:hypothetical protein
MNPCPPPEVPETLLRDGAQQWCVACGRLWIRHSGRWREPVPIERFALGIEEP